MTSKTIGHLFGTTSSFVYHFKPIGEFKLQLQSRNAQFGSKLVIFCPVWPWNLMDDLDNRAPLLCYFKLSKSFQSHWWIQTGVTDRNKANLRDLIAATGLVILLKLDSNHQFFSQCDHEIWWMTSKSNSTPLICYVKLFASFQIHRWIQMELQSSNAQFGSKSAIFLSRVIFKFDGWPWKTIYHLFYTTPSFVHHFKAIGEFKLELQSGHAQLGSKWAIFLSRVTLKVDWWPWKTIEHLFYTMSMSSFVHHMRTIGEFKLELQSGNAQIGNFLSPVTLKFDRWP